MYQMYKTEVRNEYEQNNPGDSDWEKECVS